MFRSRTQDKGLEFIARYAPDLPRRFIGDPSRIWQVIINLLGNASKFTSDGHIYLNVEKPGKSCSNVTIKFAVSDTGIGIPTHQIAAIFEKKSRKLMLRPHVDLEALVWAYRSLSVSPS